MGALGGAPGAPAMTTLLGVQMRADSATRPSRQFVDGLRMLGRGLALYGRSPRLVLFGLLPALITFVLLAAAFILLVYFINDVARAVTWFASDWPTGLRDLVRVLAGIAVLGVSALLFVVGFTALTLAIGDPFYEKISEEIDARCGGLANPVQRPWWRELLRGLGESARLVVFSAVVGIALFLAGLLPAVGQTVVPVIGALVGGWALALELTGVAFARRGMRLRDRRRILRRHRPLALGFGVGVFVCFLIPLGAVLVMPGAVAGATLLTRQIFGEPAVPGARRAAVPPSARPALGG
jgi:CysZ protein